MKNKIMLYLIASLGYYKMDISILHDSEYDKLCKTLLRDYFELKILSFNRMAEIIPLEWLEKNITQEDLESGTGYRITDYPDVVHQELKKFRAKNKL